MNRKVTVVGGAGNVGATVARSIAEKELADGRDRRYAQRTNFPCQSAEHTIGDQQSDAPLLQNPQVAVQAGLVATLGVAHGIDEQIRNFGHRRDYH